MTIRRKKFLPGSAFGDSVEGKTRREGLVKEKTAGWWIGHGRQILFITGLFLGFFILVAKLFSVTIIDGHRYRILADGNRTRELVRHAPRGQLIDRTGKPLTANLPRFRLIKTCQAGVTGSCTEYLEPDQWDRRQKGGLAAGEYAETDFARSYLFPEATAHVTGYTGGITARELASEYFSLRSYLSTDRIGREGAEAIFEETLRGRDGRELIEVDATGQKVRTLGIDREIPGSDVILSLDVGLAEAVRQAFPREYSGAVVVHNPHTGEILALNSFPSFDPNLFSVDLSEQKYQALLGDSSRPFFNRGIGGVYPPGSTYKIVTALAGLESGVFDKSTVIEDTGMITVGTFTFANWYFTQYGKTDGLVNVVTALKRSNDIFFYLMGEKIGIEKLALWSRKVGLGKLSGIELTGEATGLMPDPAWKAARFASPSDKFFKNDRWFAGDTYNIAIGQGYLLTTPLQVSLWTGVIASGGKLCKPTIAKVGQGRHSPSCFDLGLKRDTIKIIEEGLTGACGEGGTASTFINLRLPANGRASSGKVLPVACKTGTAETGNANEATHAWFTVYAPVLGKDERSFRNNEVINGLPEIVVTVLVEYGGEGSKIAAPIAKEILRHWFSR